MILYLRIYTVSQKHATILLSVTSPNENRSTFGEVTDKSIVACFFDSQCISININ